MTDAASTDLVRFSTEGGLASLVLDRPTAINALTLEMTDPIRRTLVAWRDDPEIEAVLMTGEGERGFCSGGDVRRLHAAITHGDIDSTRAFFRSEYRNNALIGAYPKPLVAVMHGVTMGGGIGLGGHANVRIVTETSTLAMPETRLGFTPDAGGSWLLAHAPGRLGEYLALTSDSMGAADAIACGFADHYVPGERIPDVVHALETRADPQTPNELVMLFDETPQQGRLEAERAWIDEAFAGDTVEEIMARLRDLPGAAPAKALAELEVRAPLSLKVTLEAIRRARELPGLPQALKQEYALVSFFVHTQPDMLEGIRAQVVDKDRRPRWHPATLAEVGDELVASAFAHEPIRPLWED